MIDLDAVRCTLAEIVRQAEVDDLPEVIGALAAATAGAQVRLMPTPRGYSDPPKLVGAAEMASLLQVPESWLRDRARAGVLPFVRLGHYMRFDPAAVIEAARKMPAAHNQQFCAPKKRKENRGGTRAVSTECPVSSGDQE